MPDLLEHMYCAQQINIPPNLPFILKQYAKAAIRTQPYDLLYWSAAYFRAKANNSPPPVKERLEYPPFDSPSRLSPGFLKVLHKQLGENEYVPVNTLYDKWLGVCLVREALDSMLQILTITATVPWLKFVAIAAGHLCPSLTKTMIMICEVLTEEPEGGSAMIPVDLFVSLYQYLAHLDCGPKLPSIQETTESYGSDSATVTVHTDQESSATKTVVSEKDSNAGLMVWSDITPDKKSDRVQSPKYTEEPGASSQYGIEVYDDAKGPVKEVITLYSAHEQVESGASIVAASESVVLDKPTEPKEPNMKKLSDLSFMVNVDWVKIPFKENPEDFETGNSKLEISEGNSIEKTERNEEETADLTSQPIEIETTVQLSEEKQEETPSNIEEDENVKSTKDLHVSESEIADETKAVADEIDTVSSSEHATPHSSKHATPQSSKHEQKSAEMLKSIKEDLSKSEVKPSQETLYKLEESVTVGHFLKDDSSKRALAYSTAEIRKGHFGEESKDIIERTESEMVARADTVHNLRPKEESSSFIEHEAMSYKSEIVKSENSDNEFSGKDIPGIGPVIPEPQILAVVEYMQYWAAKQHGMVMPRNINHILCPPLDLPPPSDADDDDSQL